MDQKKPQAPLNHHLRVLLVEDVPTDAELMERELRKAGFTLHSKRVDTENEFRAELQLSPPDLILSDYAMPQFNGMLALQVAKSLTPHIPFLLVTGTLNEETAVACIKAGADDYILKDRLARLAPAVAGALEKKQFEREREEAIASLRDSEEMFRLITESASDLIAVLDLEGRRIYNSPSYAKLTGQAVDDLMGTDSFADIHPDDRAHIREVFQETIRTGVGQRAEYRFVLRDGGIRYVESLGGVIHDENGVPDRVVVVSRDITERRNRAEELKIQKAFFEHLFQSAPAGIVIRDLQGKIFQANDEFLKMFGYSRSEVIGKSVIELLSPPGESDIVQTFADQIARGEVVNTETKRRTKGGRVLNVSIVGAPISLDGGETVVYAMYRDISERKQIEAERERLITQLQEALSDVKLLSGLLPICAWCKKIRDDQGYYHQIEEFISSHSEAEFTHGICPDCADKLIQKGTAP